MYRPVQYSTIDHLRDYNLHERENTVFNVFSGCAVACGYFVTNECLDQSSGYVSHLLSVCVLVTWLYLGLNQQLHILPTYHSDVGVRCFERAVSLILANINRTIVVGNFIQY